MVCLCTFNCMLMIMFWCVAINYDNENTYMYVIHKMVFLCTFNCVLMIVSYCCVAMNYDHENMLFTKWYVCAHVNDNV